MEKTGVKIDMDKQSIEIGPGVRTSVHCPDGKNLVQYLFEDVRTSYDAFCRGRGISAKKNCLGARRGPNREYTWITYDQTYDQAHKLGSGMVGQGLKPGEDTLVGIYAANSPEWVLTSLGCVMFSMVTVPLYDTLGPDACTFIINQTEMEVVVVDSVTRATQLLSSKEQTPTLSTLVLVEAISDELKSKAEACDVTLLSFHELVEEGNTALVDIKPPKPEDLAAVYYTSGTTGNPKGVMITHANFVADAAALVTQHFHPTSEDVLISYLPLAHIFERILHEILFVAGGSLGFYSGDVKVLVEDLQALKPTIMPVVPRLLNRIYDKVHQGVQGSAIKRFIFNLALRKKTEMVKKGIITNTSIWDKLVFSKVQAMMGGRMRVCIIGAAPTTTEILTFGRCAFGCQIFEGYGQTECTAGLTATLGLETVGGHVGAPVPCNIVKLADIPDMNYFVKDNKGEVCCKGYNVMKGYYKDPERTKETIDEDGWLHTGDVGEWLPNGTLRIIDRKKHIFKLAQGEYIAPEKIEAIYTRAPLVAQAFVDAHSVESYPVAIIVPDIEQLPAWAAKNGLKNISNEELCKSKKLKQEILDSIHKLGKEKGLFGFEQVKDVHLHPEQFSVENELATPTFKNKRPQLRKYFAQHITDLYAKIKEQQDNNNKNTDGKTGGKS